MKVFFFFLAVLAKDYLSSQTLTINISGIRNNEGSIQLAVYDSSKNFDAEKPVATKIVSKKTLLNGKLSYIITDLKPGTYGVALLDDENSNGKMNYGLILPKEGFGFSDFYLSGMSRPKFEQFDFTLTDKMVKSVEIKIRYM